MTSVQFTGTAGEPPYLHTLANSCRFVLVIRERNEAFSVKVADTYAIALYDTRDYMSCMSSACYTKLKTSHLCKYTSLVSTFCNRA